MDDHCIRSRECTVSVPKRLKADHDEKRIRRCVHTLHCIEPSYYGKYKKHKIALRRDETRRAFLTEYFLGDGNFQSPAEVFDFLASAFDETTRLEPAMRRFADELFRRFK